MNVNLLGSSVKVISADIIAMAIIVSNFVKLQYLQYRPNKKLKIIVKRYNIELINPMLKFVLNK